MMNGQHVVFLDYLRGDIMYFSDGDSCSVLFGW
jgi:hypothetical protein